MGRFYKTANPQYLDFGYEVPKEELMKATQLVSDQVDAQDDQNEGLRGLLKLDANNPDKEYADQILKGYESEIDALAREIQENPLEYRRKSSKINGLEKRITTDFTRGDAATIQAQYDSRAANLAAMKEAFEKNPDKFNYQDTMKMQQLLDQQYAQQGGYKGGMYTTDRLREYVDMNDYDKLGKDFEADIIENFGAFKGQDGFLYTSESKNEKIDPNQIFDYIANAMNNDDKLSGYLQQQVQLGNITQEQMIQRMSDTAAGIANKYGYSKSSSGLKSIKRDSMDVERQKFLWENPVTPTSTGNIKYTSLLDRYQNNGRPGDTRPNDTYSIEGVEGILSTIEQSKDAIENDIFTALADSGFKDNAEDVAKYENGDFSVLAKYGIDSSLINTWESGMRTLDRDEAIASATLENATTYEGGATKFFQDKRLAENTMGSESNIGTINVVDPTYALNKDQKAEFTSSLKAFREGFGDETTAAPWKSGRMYYDMDTIEQVAQSFENPSDQKIIRQALKEGVSINELVTLPVIQRKKIKTGQEATYMELPNGTKVPTGTTDQFGSGNTYSNFRINGKGATPTNQKDAEGRYLTMVPIEINGVSIGAYGDESKFHSQPLKQMRDTQLIEATDSYNQFRVNGVNEFKIDNFEFYNENGMKVRGTNTDPDSKNYGKQVIMTPQEALKSISIMRKIKQ